MRAVRKANGSHRAARRIVNRFQRGSIERTAFIWLGRFIPEKLT